MNVCMVGHGMMGTWHSDALKAIDCCLHTLVGRRPEPTREFAQRYGYRRWTTSLEEALADGEVEVVILANPSEMHAETALLSLRHGKHTLVEIPLAMSLTQAEQVVQEARTRGLTLGVVHPMRMQPEMVAMRERALAGEERIRHIGGRFFIHRLENVGATGYRRSWTDNLLWHHTTHLLDFGLWMLDAPVRELYSFMPPPDPKTGIPMEVVLGVETGQDQSLVCTGSYYSRERIFEALVITDHDSYCLDSSGDTLTLGSGKQMAAPWQENCARVTRDFIQSVKNGRAPAITGESVLPAMRVLQTAQDRWDERYSARAIPGRPLDGGVPWR
jgi:2-hydroxy-4-carboxymuconate semialdehyde hemiacetal dehydrogenase